MDNFIDDNEFWKFSLTIYRAPHVEDGLLLMQDRHGLDVNLILLCCWLGGRGVRLKENSLSLLIKETKPWREKVVEPLRHLRRMIKREIPICANLPTETIRQQIKVVELESEKFQQDILYSMLESLHGLDARDADRPGLMRANLLSLLSAVDCQSERAVIRPLLERMITASSQIMGIVEKVADN